MNKNQIPKDKKTERHLKEKGVFFMFLKVFFNLYTIIYFLYLY